MYKQLLVTFNNLMAYFVYELGVSSRELTKLYHPSYYPLWMILAVAARVKL